MSTFRMLPPTSANQRSRTVNGRTYIAAPGAAIDVEACDAEMLSANGWVLVAMSGPTSARPSTNMNVSPPYAASPGFQFLDTSLSAIVAVAVASAATAIPSSTLSFISLPPDFAAGMTVENENAGLTIGIVQSVSDPAPDDGTITVTLTAGTAYSVAAGDVLTFSAVGKLIVFDGADWRDPVTGEAV